MGHATYEGMKLILTNPTKVRLTLARLMRKAHAEGPDADTAHYRLLLDFGRQVLAAMKLESDLGIAEDLKEIKQALREKGMLK